jgi:hypothetical protein
MNRRLDDLLLRRGRLIERIAGQREALCRDLGPVAVTLERVDLAVAYARSGVDYLRHHALASAAAVGFLLIFKGRATLRWAGRAYSLWKSWRAVRRVLFKLGGHVRS